MHKVFDGCKCRNPLSTFLVSKARKELIHYLQSQQDAMGAFYGRDHRPDLYYTMFGLACMSMLDQDLPDQLRLNCLAPNTDELDCVHLHCLLRSHVLLGHGKAAQQLLPLIETFRSVDGGYSRRRKAECGDAYATFLAVRSYQSLKCSPVSQERAAKSLMTLQLADGSFTNDQHAKCGTVTATAAAVCALQGLGSEVPAASGCWLQSCFFTAGGAGVTPNAALSDLLSTATALEALHIAGLPLSREMQSTAMDFVEQRWQPDGGFAATAADHVTDVEYTFYGLLALQHLLQQEQVTEGCNNA